MQEPLRAIDRDLFGRLGEEKTPQPEVDTSIDPVNTKRTAAETVVRKHSVAGEETTNVMVWVFPMVKVSHTTITHWATPFGKTTIIWVEAVGGGGGKP